jgi:rare lipoprotein A
VSFAVSGRRRPGRLLSVAGLAVVSLVVGCHKQVKVANQPSAPAIPASRAPSGGTGSASRRAPGGGDVGTVAPAPVQPEVHGKPILTEEGLASWYGPP